MTTSRQQNSRLDRWGAHPFILGAWLAAFIALAVAWLLASGTAVGNPCQGAGFGCFPTERLGIEFLGFLIGLPATICWFILGLIVTPLVTRITKLRWWLSGLLTLVICSVVFAAIVAIIIQVR